MTPEQLLNALGGLLATYERNKRNVEVMARKLHDARRASDRLRSAMFKIDRSGVYEGIGGPEVTDTTRHISLEQWMTIHQAFNALDDALNTYCVGVKQ